MPACRNDNPFSETKPYSANGICSNFCLKLVLPKQDAYETHFCVAFPFIWTSISLYAQMGAHTAAEAVKKALREGIVLAAKFI